MRTKIAKSRASKRAGNAWALWDELDEIARAAEEAAALLELFQGEIAEFRSRYTGGRFNQEVDCGYLQLAWTTRDRLLTAVDTAYEAGRGRRLS